jgi:hypothetical protein
MKIIAIGHYRRVGKDDIRDLEAWADRYAHWLCGGPKPERNRETVLHDHPPGVP